MDLDYVQIDPSSRLEQDRLFTLIGPLFANRRVRREMPYLQHDEGFVWVVAVAAGGDPVGMGSVDVRGETATLRNLYVVPSCRDNGISEAITDRLIAHARRQRVRWIRTTASPLSAGGYEKRGFYRVGTRGQYITMEIAL